MGIWTPMPVDAITLESSVGKSQDISLCQLKVLIFCEVLIETIFH